MTPHELVAASVNDFHRDFPRRVIRSLQWVEDEVTDLRAVRAKRKATYDLSFYNGGGSLKLMGGLDYMMEVIRTPDYCYTLLM